MIGRWNHVAIAVPDLAAAADQYRGALVAAVSAPIALPAHGVTVVFVELPNTKIELLEPLGDTSPLAAFLQRRPSGCLPHLFSDFDFLLAPLSPLFLPVSLVPRFLPPFFFLVSLF